MSERPQLGRLLVHDPRSLNYPAKAGETLRKVTWRRYGPTLDQGATSSCTGHAMAHAINSTPAHKTRTPLLTHEDAMRLYSKATTFDPFPGQYPPDDSGSSGLAVAKAAKAEGRISAYAWAFGIDHVLHALTLAPVLLGTDWHDSMYDPDTAGAVTITGNSVGGHEYLAVGINPATKTVLCQNSWGPRWGVNGRFTLTFNQLDQLLRAGGDATVIEAAAA